MLFLIFISFIILQRLTELFIAKRNEKWLLKNNALEYGQKHYRFIVALHVLFILSMVFEYMAKGTPSINWFFVIIWFILIALKAWTISSLGKYWNTKIFHVPGMKPVTKGPYRFLNHPNYVIVISEIAIIPLVFHLYFTAVIFSILNAIILTIRIKEENKAWSHL